MTDQEKANIYDRIVNIINDARQDELDDLRDFDTSNVLEQIENVLSEDV